MSKKIVSVCLNCLIVAIFATTMALMAVATWKTISSADWRVDEQYNH